MRILGIDPGSGIIGFGVIDNLKSKSKFVGGGVIRTKIGAKTSVRLLEAYEGMQEILSEYKPDVATVEKLFFVQNITTGMKVSQTRGIILLALEQYGLPIYEYAPNEIKMAMTGYGHAKKGQIQEMVKVQLDLKQRPSPDDVADALAIALTHKSAHI
ncbi:MAG: crossover junction endodeoxyribonuclease RuvC [Lactovum sp.]